MGESSIHYPIGRELVDTQEARKMKFSYLEQEDRTNGLTNEQNKWINE